MSRGSSSPRIAKRRRRRNRQPILPQGAKDGGLIEAAGASLLDLQPTRPTSIRSKKAFAKLKALLRKAAERVVDGPWIAIGRFLYLFALAECRNYFDAADYDAT
jgi:hypothetical protein